MPDKTTLSEEGKTLFEKQQKKGMISEVEGDITRFQPGSGLTPSASKILKGTTAGTPPDFDETGSHSVSEVKGEDFRPSGEKIMKGTKLEGDEEVKKY